MISLPHLSSVPRTSRKFTKILKFQSLLPLFLIGISFWPDLLCINSFELAVDLFDCFFLASHDGSETEAKKRKFDESVSGTPVLVLPSGCVPCNSHIRQMIKIVKPYIWHLVEDANLVLN